MLHSEPSCDGGVACGSAAGEGWCREAGRATESTRLVVLSLFAERGESADGNIWKAAAKPDTLGRTAVCIMYRPVPRAGKATELNFFFSQNFSTE